MLAPGLLPIEAASAPQPWALIGPQPLHWYRPESLAGAIDGSTVATWTDEGSVGSDLLQAFGGFRPTYRANRWRGFGALDFDGFSDVMATAPGLGPYAAPFSLLVVAGTPTSNNQSAWGGRDAQSHPRVRMDAGTILQLANGVGVTTPTDPSSSLAYPVVALSANPGSVFAPTLGKGTGNAGTFDVDRLFVGNGGSVANPFDGLIFEMAFTVGDQVTAFRQYVFRKYGLAPRGF